MVSIRHKTRNRTAYPYTYIQKISFDPSTGIVIELPEETLVLRGSHLQEVYEGLLNQIIEFRSKIGHLHKGKLGASHRREATRV